MANQRSGDVAPPALGDRSTGSARAPSSAVSPATGSTVRRVPELGVGGLGSGATSSSTSTSKLPRRQKQDKRAQETHRSSDVRVTPEAASRLKEPPEEPAGLHTPLALSTRSKKPAIVYDKGHRWEAYEIEMSRNRPRGAARDNGQAANEEIDMWNKIVADLTKAKEKNDRQKVLSQNIGALNEKIGKNGSKPSMDEIDQLDKWHREMMKLAEEEKDILTNEPADVIKNVEILMALRSASEADPHSRAASGKPRKRKTDLDNGIPDSPGPSTGPVSEKLNRLKSSAQRSASVSSAQTRESAKGDEVTEGIKGTKGTAAEKGGQLFVGAEVVFKHNKKQQGVEGEGIQCIIKNITGDGHKKRYDVQDPEPIENGEEGAVYRTTAASLIPIPQIGTSLPVFPPGKQVLARYPDTTTFYRAEVMGSKKDVYRLKFEGEEDDKEMDVDRRFVLDIPGK
ncbi:SAGA complex component [Coccidioides immitis RS]|uniref:SAGA complex component n=4 Tax=Coccidioides immitis TaxID=5501 RepID=J3K701_COCIM|nr:SAGA complex component [Coccidioides immitis RS]KMP02953.1 SAGA-associated factor 29 [Coccidioides immitis RMSCC 2394]KMU77396.1 SAGA-associated factor 29 [Coccidioides immitis RMSCC 3703]KMU90741.1 SAGA-associated factor 29 [Coccidioides immitis H538.4]TPX23377.1 SAGA HAT/Core module component [Coccidioides immitis]EAS30410.3 SAGA complex component [Coccidioides immitis RS]